MEQAQLVRNYGQSKYYPLVSKIFSYPLFFGMAGSRYRRDFVYISNETGVPLAYRWDLATDTHKLLSTGEESVFPILGGMALHHDPTSPKFAFAKDKAGDLNHNVCIVDLSKGDTNTITRAPMGTILYLFWSGDDDDDGLIVVGHDKESVYVKKLAVDGDLHDLYITDKQVTGACYDPKRNTVIFVVGRGADSKVALLDVSQPSDIRWTGDTGIPPFIPPTVNAETGLLAYTVDTPKGQELSVVSLDSLQRIKQIPIPGAGFLDWLDDHRLFGAVLKDGRLSPRILDVRDGEWSEPLSDASALWTASTIDGPVWVANSLSQPPYLQTVRSGRTVNLTEPQHVADFEANGEWYNSFDGRRVHGMLLKSPVPDARLVVYLHGGPTALQGDWWYPEIPSLVLGGFHVFAPNFRGSDGYGAEFRDLNLGDLGGGDLKDIQAAAKHATHLLDLPAKDKPAVVGGSYGGYLTLMALVVHPDDWKGGVAIAPPTDYLDEFGSDDAHYKSWCVNFFGGTPQEKEALYRDRSPITHIDRLRSSVLLIAGENDSIVTLNSVRKFAAEAEKKRLPVELVISKDEGHGSLQSDNMIRDTVLMLEHLKKLYEGPP